MIDFNLTTENLVRRDSMKASLKGASVNLEYMLHKQDVRNPKDPEGDSITLWCLYLPQINTSYIDSSEELVFEALEQFFEEDFVRYMAERLVEERNKREEENDSQQPESLDSLANDPLLSALKGFGNENK